MTPRPNELIIALRDVLVTYFNEEGLKDFALALGIDFENIPGPTKKAKARELAEHLWRHSLMPRLASVGPQERPDIDWAGILDIYGYKAEAAAPPMYQIDSKRPLPSGYSIFGIEPEFEPVVGDEARLELVVNSEDNFLDIDVLAGAIYTAQAVGRIEIPHGTPKGTGFLVGPDLLLTSYHVIKSPDVLAAAVVRFDYHANADGGVAPGRVFAFRPDFYNASIDTELDFALLRLESEPLAGRGLQPEDEEQQGYLGLVRRGRHRGYLVVAPDLIVERERVNIIQHPNGDPQKAVLTQNYVVATMSADRVHYLADTLPGSSGAPVLNRHWQVVALHHSGGPHPPAKVPRNLRAQFKGNYRFNEGIPMRAILPHIEQYLPRQ